MARSHFSSQALVLIVISIAINMIGGQLASMVKLPIFIDQVRAYHRNRHRLHQVLP
ncbi:hypothetical protein ACUODJ_21895, partial [Escherichia sp. HC-CC]